MKDGNINWCNNGIHYRLSTSFLFWDFLRNIKPQIDVSPILSYNTETKKIRIKVINRTNRLITSINASLSVMEYRPNLNTSHIVKIKGLDFLGSKIKALGPKKNLGNPWSLYPVFIYSAILEDLSILDPEILGYERRLVFTIDFQDSISGTRDIRKITYKKSDICEAKFALGLDVNTHSKFHFSELNDLDLDEKSKNARVERDNIDTEPTPLNIPEESNDKPTIMLIVRRMKNLGITHQFSDEYSVIELRKHFWVPRLFNSRCGLRGRRSSGDWRCKKRCGRF